MSATHKRPSQSQAQSLSAKRAKFDGRHATKLAPEETFDPLEEDIGVGASRKKDIKLDGYASDSSEEGHGVKRAPALENETGPVDDDDDMFGEAPSKQADRRVHDKEDDGGDKFMELEDIEGQDFNTRTEFMDIVDEGSEVENDDDSVDEEVGALGRKTNAPKMDSFNMSAELEEGKFDADGNYIRTAKDQKDNQDNWLKDVSRKDIAAAKEAVERRQREEADRVEKEDQTSVGELLAELVEFLDRGETLLECLARLGSSAGPKRRKEKKGKAKEDGNVKKIERMTELANRLMAKTQLEVYDTEREGLMRAYKRETGEELPVRHTQDELMPDDVETARDWEFVWEGAEDQLNGPYDTSTMKAWLSAGLLKSDTSIALVRKVGEISFVEATESVLAH